ncbi:hypothetical protein WA577_005747, partial [Blastocystis sp. JDR]
MDRNPMAFSSPYGSSVMRDQGDEEDYSLYSLKNISFKDNLAEMMFGFGDSIEPYEGSIQVMDELLKDFITNLTLRSMDIAKRCNRPFDYECIQFAVRDKEGYYWRLKELLTAFDEIASQSRYSESDLDTSADAKKRANREERKLLKKQKLEEMHVEE